MNASSGDQAQECHGQEQDQQQSPTEDESERILDNIVEAMEKASQQTQSSQPSEGILFEDAAELSNQAIQELRHGNLHLAYTFIYNAVSRIEFYAEEITERRRVLTLQQTAALEANKRANAAIGMARSNLPGQKNQRQDENLIPDRDCARKAAALQEYRRHRLMQLEALQRPPQDDDKPIPPYQFEWFKVLGGTDTFRDVRKRWLRAQNDPRLKRIADLDGSGLATDFLFVRPIHIIASDRDVNFDMHRLNTSDNPAKVPFYAWAVWFNAAIIYQLVCDELGEQVKGIIAHTNRWMALVQLALDLDGMVSLSEIGVGRAPNDDGPELIPEHRILPRGIMQWHIVLLSIRHNQACWYYETAAQLGLARRIMAHLDSVISIALARRSWHTQLNHDDRRWVPATDMAGTQFRDESVVLCQWMAIHAQIFRGNTCARVA